jgi:hypothetical protein
MQRFRLIILPAILYGYEAFVSHIVGYVDRAHLRGVYEHERIELAEHCKNCVIRRIIISILHILLG